MTIQIKTSNDVLITTRISLTTHQYSHLDLGGHAASAPAARSANLDAQVVDAFDNANRPRVRMGARVGRVERLSGKKDQI